MVIRAKWYPYPVQVHRELKNFHNENRCTAVSLCRNSQLDKGRMKNYMANTKNGLWFVESGMWIALKTDSCTGIYKQKHAEIMLSSLFSPFWGFRYIFHLTLSRFCPCTKKKKKKRTDWCSIVSRCSTWSKRKDWSARANLCREQVTLSITEVIQMRLPCLQ